MNYYININNNNPNQNNEVHKEDCRFMPLPNNRKYIGDFSNGIDAVAAARKMGYSKADGCAFCCPEAHRG